MYDSSGKLAKEWIATYFIIEEKEKENKRKDNGLLFLDNWEISEMPFLRITCIIGRNFQDVSEGQILKEITNPCGVETCKWDGYIEIRCMYLERCIIHYFYININ